MFKLTLIATMLFVCCSASFLAEKAVEKREISEDSTLTLDREKKDLNIASAAVSTGYNPITANGAVLVGADGLVDRYEARIIDASVQPILTQSSLGPPPPSALKQLTLKQVTLKQVTWQNAPLISALGYGIERIGCGSCNAYNGDQLCTSSLPILCVAQTGIARPPYPCPGPGAAMPAEFYCGWSEGNFKITPPIRGTQLLSFANMNAKCQAAWGPAFKAVEHHMGLWKYGMGNNVATSWGNWWNAPAPTNGGWYLYGYGDLPLNSQRYWIYVKNQPNAHCF